MPLEPAEREALAVLRAGGSFEDAAAHSGLSIDQVIRLWRRVQDDENENAN